ncbi:Protein transport protein sec20 [Tilletia horrida]|uniref:Protein transport protein sec20 n=1 Tax=Tilletia horrida TaxID=155126 RepID=A0AAN6JJ24_9BASI|nr:Protein transport protein sec20 [Tilletia horrida]
MAHPSQLAASLDRHLRAIDTLSLPALHQATDKPAIESADAQLGADLDAASDLFRRLRLCLDDADSAQERADIETVLDESGRELNRLRIASRGARSSAYARAKTAAAQAARQELSLLGAAGSGFARPNPASSAEGDKVQTAAADVTSALQRTVQFLSNEVERSTFSAQLLEESSATLQLLNSEYTSFGNVLKNSVTLIKSMEREDWYNFLMVAGSMAFFLGCVLYILKKRIYDNTAGVVLSGAGSVLGKGWRGGAKALKAAKASKSSAAAAALKAASSSSSAALAASRADSAASMAAASSATAAAIAASAAAAATAAAEAANQAQAALGSSSTPSKDSGPGILYSDAETILQEYAEEEAGGDGLEDQLDAMFSFFGDEDNIAEPDAAEAGEGEGEGEPVPAPVPEGGSEPAAAAPPAPAETQIQHEEL